MRVLVTGGTGFIGSVVVAQLVAAGHDVRCLVRTTSNTQRIDHVPYEKAVGDVRNPEALRQAVRGCDAILHLAGLSAWDEIKSPAMHDVVAGGTKNVLDAAMAEGQPRTVVVSSSIAVNGTEQPVIQDETSACTLNLASRDFVYAKAKIDAEALCRRAVEQGLPVVVVNPCEVYGPNDTKLVTAGNLKDVANSSPALICRGGTSVIHVDDVAAGIIAAMERGRVGERYVLGGDNLTVRQLAELTIDILGQKKSILELPNGLIRTLAHVGEALHIPLPFNPMVIPYATLFWFFDNAKARSELRVSFRGARECLEPAVSWLVEAGHVKATTRPRA